MSNNYNKNLSTLSKYNKSKLRKVDTDDQSAFGNSVIIDLVKNVVDHANKLSDHLSLLNNSLRSKLLENTISELQVPESPSNSQKPELELQEVEVQEDLELFEGPESYEEPEPESEEEPEFEPKFQEADMNEYIQFYNYLDEII
ncbi:hypothetical protein F8M41_015326 [Gigaspora margarita]|uniref:Uncharacterized protein n=1 Tax=Gigaspora margarita TaxID=4874 RepID=A0A8H4A0A8_GIGMA|nr:hypothetical protein F8M41_015326 [Gigaspora margarita]